MTPTTASAGTRWRRERLDRGIKARCDDIFALTSWREMAYLGGPRTLATVALVVMPLLGFLTGTYWQTVYLIALVVMLLAVSWSLLASVGLVSLGQALFFGAGAYLAGILAHAGWAPLPALVVGTLAGSVLCTLLLAPVLRLRGVYFSLVTFALPLLFARIIEATKILGGTEGMSGLPALGGLAVRQYLLVAAVLAAVFGFQRLLDSDYGVVLRAIRENDLAVRAAGIPVHRSKAQAVFLAALPACLAGGVVTFHYQVVGMSAFSLEYSVLPLAAALVGGSTALAGPALGAAVLVPLSELLRAFGTLRVVAYALLLVLFTVAVPEGFFVAAQRRYHQFERLVPLE